MKMKRILSCLMAAAMVGGLAVMPVSAANAQETVTTVDKLYYEAENINTNNYHTFTSSNTTVRGSLVGKNMIRITDSDSVFFPDKTMTFSFEAVTDGLYTFESFMVDALNRRKGEYELYVNDKKYEMKAADGNDADKHTTDGQSFTTITASDVELHKGTNELKLVAIKGSTDDSAVWSMYIDYIQFTNQCIYDAKATKQGEKNFVDCGPEDIIKPPFDPWLYVDSNGHTGQEGEIPWAEYKINVPKEGNYYLMACARKFDTSFTHTYDISVNGQSYTFTSETTDSYDASSDYNVNKGASWYKYKITPVHLEAGEVRLKISVPAFYKQREVLGLRALGLIPTTDAPVEDPEKVNPITMNQYSEKEENDDDTFNIGFTSEGLNVSGYDYIVFKFDDTAAYGHELGMEITGEGNIVLGVLLKNVNKEYENSNISFYLTNEADVKKSIKRRNNVMKKYIDPKMEIKSFYSESVLTGSALETQMTDWQSGGDNHTLLTIDMQDAQQIKVTF